MPHTSDYQSGLLNALGPAIAPALPVQPEDPLSARGPAVAFIVSGIRSNWLRFDRQRPLALEEAIYTALASAPEIQILNVDVEIAESEITRQQAAFDWNTFVNSNWNDRNTPVGSALDGVQTQLNSQTVNTAAGLRKLNQYAGQLRLAQDVNFNDSNSQFLNPRNQAIANLGITYSQPLLQGGGKVVATSRYRIAIIDTDISKEGLMRGMQDHLFLVVDAYWNLAFARGTFAISKMNLDRAKEIVHFLEQRKNLDVVPTQMVRTQASIASRSNTLLQQEYAIVAAQEQLLRVMLGPGFPAHVNEEFVTTSELSPSSLIEGLSESRCDLAIQNRPEIRGAFQRIKRAATEQDVAENQLLPALGMVLTVGSQGLQGNRAVIPAIGDQYQFGNVSVGTGIEYLRPNGNRAAKENLRQVQLRIRRLQSELEMVTATVCLETRNAERNLTLAAEQMDLAITEVAFASRELDVLKTRLSLLLDGDNNIGQLYIDSLIQSQDRLAASEFRLLSTMIQRMKSEFELQRATGMLLREFPEAK